MPAGLDFFLASMQQALQQAGIPANEGTVTLASQAWNYWGGQNQSQDWFVSLLQTLSSTPEWQQQLTPYTQQQNQGGYYIDPAGYNQQQQGNWEAEQKQYFNLAQLMYDTQVEIAGINDASARYIAELQAAVQRAIADGYITSAEGLSALELAQRESEFARTLALQTLMSDRSYEIAQQELALREREMKAQLAANPADWLTYQAFLGGGELPGAGAPGEGAGPASPADLKEIAERLTTPSGALYNPAMAGVGVAGAHVPGPQEVSRQEMYNMTPTDMAMFGGFLRGGIEIGDEGKRVSINPEDWFQQASRGWVPAIGEESFLPVYG